MKTTILLIRHGAVENPRRVFYGRQPRFSLSTNGRKEVASASEMLAPTSLSQLCGNNSSLSVQNPSAIFCSPMLRARQTTQIIARFWPEVHPQISSLLNEVYSPYDGCSWEMLENLHWEIYQGIPPEYEQPADVLARILKFVTETRQRFPGGQILAVTHGDLIYFLTLWAAGQVVTGKKNQTFYPATASISSFIFDEQNSDRPEYHYYQAGVS